MTRFLAIAAAAATLAGAPAFAQQADNPEVTMLTGKVYRALRDCDIDGNMVDTLTMAQVAGITIAASSDSEGQKCEKIKSIAQGG